MNNRKYAYGKLSSPSLSSFAISLVAVALLLPGTTSPAAPPQADRCHVLLASNQCVDLMGAWKHVPIKGEVDILEIKAPDRRHLTFPFVVDAAHGGSTTHIEGEFILKQNVGLYTDEHPEKGAPRCSLVFVPLSTDELKVIGFGICEEGRGAVPDGTYLKVKSNAHHG